MWHLALPQFNADAMQQLGGMGFSEIRCQKALLASGNSSAEAAMEWLFAHMEDPGSHTFLLITSIITTELLRHRCAYPAGWYRHIRRSRAKS